MDSKTIRLVRASKFARDFAPGMAALALLLWAAPASAQLSRVGSTLAAMVPGGIIRGTDAAYDPVNNVYLVVTGNGPVYGAFVDASGQAVTAPFPIFSNDASNYANFPRAHYSSHAANGAGGQGAFLVTWIHNIGSVNYVFGRLVSFAAPGGLVSSTQMISDGADGGVWHETGPAMAYSATSQRFLVAWRTFGYAIHGRFVDTAGAPTGAVAPLENPGGSRDPSLAWNPATDEFGLMYTGFGGSGALVSFRRIRASDGANLGRTSFGFSGATFATGIDVNSSNEYVLAWAIHPGTLSTRFDSGGNQVGATGGTLVTSRFGYDQSLDIAFNGMSKSVLAVGSDGQSWEIAGAEMNSAGTPISTAEVITDGALSGLGSNYPLTTSRPGVNQWNVAYSRNFNTAANQIMASNSDGTAPPTPAPTPTPTPTPTPEPTPTPTPSPGNCSTPDPFVALGGGTCCNGGWVPPGMSCPGAPAPTPSPTPTPTPPPTPSTCSTADPFASLGGGTCCNGGWLPPGLPCADPGTPPPPPTPPPPTDGGCSTHDPFVSLGGGTCCRGGWLPPGMACK